MLKMRILLILWIGMLISIENGVEGRSNDENEVISENVGHDLDNTTEIYDESEQQLRRRKRKKTCSNGTCNSKCKKNRYPVGRCTSGKCVCTGKKSKMEVDLDICIIVEGGQRPDQMIDPQIFKQVTQDSNNSSNTYLPCTATKEAEPIERVGLISTQSRWPWNPQISAYVVPFVMSSVFSTNDRNVIFSSLAEMEMHSCVRFIFYATNTELERNGMDYIGVQDDNTGCNSYVGRLGRGRQPLNLQRNQEFGGLVSGCIFKGIVQHEFLHALGFDHEQNSPERDEYVYVNYTNVQTRYVRNYRKNDASKVSDFGYPYDYGSVMHYGLYDFAIDSNIPVMIVLKDANGAQIGQRTRYTETDIGRVNGKYVCNGPVGPSPTPAPTSSPTPPPSQNPDVCNEANKCLQGYNCCYPLFTRRGRCIKDGSFCFLLFNFNNLL